MLAKVEMDCLVLGALAWEMRDHGQAGVSEALRGGGRRRPSMDIDAAAERVERLVLTAAHHWAPDILGQCGVPEDVFGELRLTGRSLESVADALEAVHDAVVEIDPTAGDYNAFRAMSDARWAVEHLAQAVCSALVGDDLKEDGRIRDAAESYEEAARHVARLSITKTAPKVPEVIAWVLEEVA